jgi:REP element-mobilizing transposase RayT
MPVYLLTAHAYRSWKEDDPEGYVQRGEGPKAPDEKVAADRAGRAKFEEARFEFDVQELLQDVVAEIAHEKGVRLHACSTCPTHVHAVVSFRSPACACGAVNHCSKDCEARDVADGVMVRMKRKMGQAIAKKLGTSGRKWISRGWDRRRVAGREHFSYLMETYLPKHEAEEGGIFRRYG